MRGDPTTHGELKTHLRTNHTDPVTGARVKLTGLQASSTLDPEFQKKFPGIAIKHKYRPGKVENTFGYKLGQGADNFLHRSSMFGKIADKGPVHGGLVGAGLGGALGLGAGFIADRFSDGPSSMGKWGLIAALLGGALGAYSGYNRTKQASVYRGSIPDNPPDLAEINAAISRDPILSFHQKATLMTGVSQLSPQDSRRLKVIMGATIGASAGVTAAKFLLSAGLGGTVISAVMGGMLGSVIAGSQPPTNALGQRSTGGADIFGNPYNILFPEDRSQW